VSTQAAHLSKNKVAVAIGYGTDRIFPMLEEMIIATPVPIAETNFKIVFITYNKTSLTVV
jgi:hypothetical protein